MRVRACACGCARRYMHMHARVRMQGGVGGAAMSEAFGAAVDEEPRATCICTYVSVHVRAFLCVCMLKGTLCLGRCSDGRCIGWRCRRHCYKVRRCRASLICAPIDHACNTNIHSCACAYTHAYAPARVCMHVCVHARAHTCVVACMRVCVYAARIGSSVLLAASESQRERRHPSNTLCV